MTQYWALSRMKHNETEETFEYGDKFPDLKDKQKMEMLLNDGRISKVKPSNIPLPPGTQPNQFERSAIQVKLPEESEEEVGQKKSKEDKK